MQPFSMANRRGWGSQRLLKPRPRASRLIRRIGGSPAVCHACGTPDGAVHANTRKFIRDLNFGDFTILLQVEHRKIQCAQCREVRVEELEFVDASARVTRQLAAHAAGLCASGLSVEAVARRLPRCHSPHAVCPSASPLDRRPVAHMSLWGSQTPAGCLNGARHRKGVSECGAAGAGRRPRKMIVPALRSNSPIMITPHSETVGIEGPASGPNVR